MTQVASSDILIVDDTPANLTVLSTILAKEGYRVRPALNGDLALRAAQKALPDLILLDIQMPGLDGYEVCRRLKADAQTRHVPVIFISALEDAIDKVEAFQVGGVDYITKPFQIEEVLVRVKNQLALQHERARISELREGLAAILMIAEQLQAEATPAQTELVARLIAQLHGLHTALGEAP